MENIQNHMRMFNSTRETSWLIMVLVAIVQIASTLFVNNVLYQGDIFKFLRDIRGATSGIITPTLIANLVPLVFIVGLVIFVIGRLRPLDVGWVWELLMPALLITFGLWVFIQLILIVIAALGEGEINIHHSWAQPGTGYVIGGVLGQMFGNALAEETVFRGFFFTQFYKKFVKRFGITTAVIWAALTSQIGFALIHIPNRLLVKGVIGPELITDQFMLILGGLIFVVIYMVTKNIFVAVGLHAIANDPAPLIQTSNGVVAIAWLVSVVLLLFLWNRGNKLIHRLKAQSKGVSAHY